MFSVMRSVSHDRVEQVNIMPGLLLAALRTMSMSASNWTRQRKPVPGSRCSSQPAWTNSANASSTDATPKDWVADTKSLVSVFP